MSNPAGPEDRTPRRARDEDGAVSQDARIHDARQDAARQDTARTNDTRAIPTGDATAAPTRNLDAVHAEPTRSQPVTAVRHDEPARATDGNGTLWWKKFPRGRR